MNKSVNTELNKDKITDKSLNNVVKFNKEVEHFSVELDKSTSFIATSKRTYIKTLKIEKGEAKRKEILLCDKPIYPVKIVSTDNENYVQLAFKTLNDKEETTTLPMSDITHVKIKYLGHLAAHGFDFEDKRLRLGKWLSSAISQSAQQGLIQTEEGQNHTGWNKDVTEHILPGHSNYGGTGLCFLEKKGNKEEYITTIREIVKESPIIGICLSAAVGSFLRGVISFDDTTYLHLKGSSSTGKSIINKITASLVGCPKDLIYPWSATRAGLERKLHEQSNMFLNLDELSQIRQNSTRLDQIRQLIMGLANGGNRLVAASHSDSVRNTKFWNTTIISTGNESILEFGRGSEQEEAIAARAIEIDIDNHPIFENRDTNFFIDLETFLTDNYGHLYDDIISMIKNIETRKKVIKTFYLFSQEFLQDVQHSFLARKGKSYALISSGIYILSELIGDDVMQDTINKLIELRDELLFSDMSKDEDDVSFINETLLSIIAEHKSRIGWKGYLHDGGNNVVASVQAQNARDQSREADSKGLLGIFHQEEIMRSEADYNGKFYIMRNESVKAKFKGVNFDELARKAKNLGLLVTDNDKHNPSTLRKSHRKLGSTYCFIVKSIETDEELSAKVLNEEIIDTNPEDAFD